MSTTDITNYLKVNNQLITSGQPTPDQLHSAAMEGFVRVINLATSRSTPHLEGEAELVHSLGMAYIAIPVDWENPTEADFAAFESVLHQASGKTLLHCAANYRATAFYSLYTQKHLGWSDAQAEAFCARVWSVHDYPVWEKFITQIRETFRVS